MSESRELPGSVLFVCAMNAVRSPMAMAILQHLSGSRIAVRSAGVRAGDPDPFLVPVMNEIGIDMSRHRPQTLEDLADQTFDLIVTLTPEAHHQALELNRTLNTEVEYWPTQDPTTVIGHVPRNQVLETYRGVRDQLFDNIKKRFAPDASPVV